MPASSQEDDLGTILERFKWLCNYNDPMIKRAAAANIGTMANVCGPEQTTDVLMPLWDAFLDEKEQESIRSYAIKASASFFANQPPSSADTLTKCWNKLRECASDKSWQVRQAVGRALPEVARDAKGCTAEQRKEMGELFVRLLTDTETEVWHATAVRSAAAAQSFPGDLREMIFEQVRDLVLDDKTDMAKRIQLADALLEMGMPLGSERAKRLFLAPSAEYGNMPLLFKLLEEEQTNLKLIVIKQLPALFQDELIPLGDAAGQQTIEKVRELCNADNWRVRHESLQACVWLAKYKLDSFCTKEEGQVPAGFLPRLGMDSCALVRRTWVEVTVAIVSTEGYGGEWWAKWVKPVLVKAADDANYLNKAVLLDALPAFAALDDLKTKGDDLNSLVEKALVMADHEVPNLRLLAATSLGRVYSAIDHPGLKDQIKRALQTMEGDGDADVKENARAALGLI